MIDQIEFADILIINKIDLVENDDLKKIETLIHRLNPSAKVFKTFKCNLDIKQILNTKLFNFDKAMLSPGWLASIRGDVAPESEEYNIKSFIYRARKPFHPGRLNILMSNKEYMRTVIRSKGFSWLASRPQYITDWVTVGNIFTLEKDDIWIAERPQHEIDEILKEEKIRNDFDTVIGDRRQEIVFIGIEMDKDSLINSLNNCLLTDEEMSMGKDFWIENFEDDFESWSDEDHDHDHDDNESNDDNNNGDDNDDNDSE